MASWVVNPGPPRKIGIERRGRFHLFWAVGVDVQYPVDLGERAQTIAHWCVGGCAELGSVEIYRELMTAALRWIIASKL